MKLPELKNQLTLGVLPTDFLILVNPKDSTFLSKQYVNAMIGLATGGVNRITSIYEPIQSSLLNLVTAENTLNLLYVDTFSERAEDYTQFDYTVVVCNQIDKTIEKAVEEFTIKLPKLSDWQIIDYAKMQCKCLDEADIGWLVKAADNNIERVMNELDKISLFSGDEQKQLFAAIQADRKSGLYSADLFSVVNALIDGDTLTLYNFLLNGGADLLEPVVLVNRAFANLKAILLTTQNVGMTPADLGVSSAQFYKLRKQYASLNIEAARLKLKFLAGLDLALKTSQLDMNKHDMLSYLIANVAYKITR